MSKPNFETESESEPLLPIICRPAPTLWVFIGICLTFFLLMVIASITDSKSQSPTWIALLIALFYGIPGFYGTIYMQRTVITADENGLRWRGALTGWKSARWDEITDFYLSGSPRTSRHSQSSRRGASIYSVEMGQQHVSFGRDQAHSLELQRFIAKCATQTKYREWLFKDLRPGATFRRIYQPILLPLQVFLGCCVLFLGVSAFTFVHNWHEIQSVASGISTWQFLMAYVIPMSFVSCLLASPLLIPMALFLGNLKYRSESLTLTPQGIEFNSREANLNVTWEQWQDVMPVKGGFLFHTSQGNWKVRRWFQIEPMFVAIASIYAPHVDVEHAQEAAAGVPRTAQEEALFFSRQTYGNLLLVRLAFAGALACSFLLLFLVLLSDDFVPQQTDPNSMRYFLAMYPLVLWPLALWAWRYYQRGGIGVDNTGLEFRGVRRSQWVLWPQVEIYGRTPEGYVFVRANGKRWRIGDVVGKSKLLAEIKRRATNATQEGEWL